MKRFEEIIKLKNEGLTVKKIGEKLNIGQGTVGYYLKKARENNIIYDKILPSNLRGHSVEEVENFRKKHQETSTKKLLNTPFDELSWDLKKKRIILEQENKCIKCSTNIWMGQKIILEIDHKDGNNNNNLRNNLEGLCPNCHSLTNTWRGKNKKLKSNRNKYTDEDLLKSLIENKFNIRQTLLSLKLSPKGGNYKRMNKVLINYLEN